MNDQNRTPAEWRNEVAALRQQVHDLEAERARRREVEERLRESEARYRSLLQTQAAAIARSDLSGRLTVVNDAYCKMFGKPREDWIGSMFVQTVIPEDQPVAMAMLEELQSPPYRKESETRHCTPLGVRWLLWDNAAILDESGKVTELQGTGRDITERKRLEEESRRLLAAVQEERDRLLALVNSIADEVWFADAQGNFTLANAAARQEFGYGPTNGLEVPVEELANSLEVYRLDGSPRPLEETPPLRALQGETVRNVEELVRTPASGELRVRQVSSAPVRDAHGRITGSVSVVRDITDHRRRDEAMWQSETRYRQLISEMHDCFVLRQIICDTEGQAVDYVTLEVNKAFEALRQVRREEIVGQRGSQTIPPEELAQWMKIFGPVALTGQSAPYTMYSAQNQRYYEGQVYSPQEGQFALTFADVTARKRAEEERDRILLLSLDLIGVLSWDDGYFKYVNPAWERILGYTRQELLSRPLLDFVHPDDQAKTAAQAALLAAGEQTVDFENRCLCQDGSERVISWVATPVLAPRLIYCVGRDITAQRRLEEQFRQAQKMRAVGTLAGGVAHEFNNILTAIIGYTELVRRSLGNQDPRRQDLEAVKKSAERAAALVRQLLAFSRKQILQPQVLDLNALVRHLSPVLRQLLSEDIELILSLEPALGAVEADPTQLEQVLLSLVSNARDAMPQVGSLTITTSDVVLDEAYARCHAGAQPGPYVRLTVSDTGIGMSEEVKAHLFEPFFTTKDVGQGTGLGLAATYGIVKQSGGYIAVQSEPGRGATFQIHLPRLDPTLSKPPGLLPAAAPARGHETILLAEDDEAVRRVAQQALADVGYTVLEAGDGPQAFAIFERHGQPIDLLVTDVVMPGGLSGPDLAGLLTDQRPGLKVLYMSGHTEDAILRHGLRYASANFLAKPFAPDQLTRQVRAVLDNL